MNNKVTIRKGQLGLLAKQGDFYQVLDGTYETLVPGQE